VKRIDPLLARRLRDADLTRSRRNFELHVKLGDPLLAWYRTMERVLPRSVIWNLPDNGLAILAERGNPPNRSSIAIFDQVVGLLPTRMFTSAKYRSKAPEE
jgi:hypothetical protein